jgi:hypothetical protein
MKMKDHNTDDWGDALDGTNNNLGQLLRQRLDAGIIPIRCDTDELKKIAPVMIGRKTNMNKTIDETLEQRGNNYGDYRDVAYAAQELKKTLRYSKSWHSMEPYMQESLDMICNKMSRIVNGNPYYDDSWHDICGYATLVEKQLEKK